MSVNFEKWAKNMPVYHDFDRLKKLITDNNQYINKVWALTKTSLLQSAWNHTNVYGLGSNSQQNGDSPKIVSGTTS